jgi:hypothetical protein
MKNIIVFFKILFVCLFSLQEQRAWNDQNNCWEKISCMSLASVFFKWLPQYITLCLKNKQTSRQTKTTFPATAQSLKASSNPGRRKPVQVPLGLLSAMGLETDRILAGRVGLCGEGSGWQFWLLHRTALWLSLEKAFCSPKC